MRERKKKDEKPHKLNHKKKHRERVLTSKRGQKTRAERTKKLQHIFFSCKEKPRGKHDIKQTKACNKNSNPRKN